MKISNDIEFQNKNKNITEKYFQFLDQHILDVASGKETEFMEINKIASELCVSHQYLIEILQNETGNHPCYFYELKILNKAKDLLINTDLAIKDIASKLTYDSSNFNKYFKRYEKITPGQYRKEHKK